MLDTNFFILMTLTAVAFRQANCGIRPKRSSGNPFDTTTATQNVVAEMMNDFMASLKQWKSAQFAIDEVDMEGIFGSPSVPQNNMIAYGPLSIRQTFKEPKDEVQIECNFSKAIQIRMPLSKYSFTSSFNITDERSMSTEFKYTIKINNAKVNFTEIADPSHTRIPNDKYSTDITYDPIIISLEIPRETRDLATKAMRDIPEKIHAMLKSALEKKLVLQLHSNNHHNKIFQICTNPGNFIKQFYHTFAPQHQSKYYYYIGARYPENCIAFGSQMNWVTIRNLWNFVSLNVKDAGPSYGVEFALGMDEVCGETNWDYYIEGEHLALNENATFTADNLVLKLSMDLESRNVRSITNLDDIKVNGNGHVTISEMLLNKILQKKLKSTIDDELVTPIQNKYRDLAREYF